MRLTLDFWTLKVHGSRMEIEGFCWIIKILLEFSNEIIEIDLRI